MTVLFRHLGLGIGRILFWLAWPAFQVYYRRGKRTRVLIVDEHDQLLLVKGWINDGLWNLSGGGLHPGEDPLLGAVREVAEEVGIAITPTQLQPLGEAMYHRIGLRFAYVMYFVRVPQSELHLQRHEIADARWIAPSDVATVPVGQEVIASLQAARSRRLLQ
jgi:8-oxo-dGTP pyrophosphatase MutT (NUDIX family)